MEPLELYLQPFLHTHPHNTPTIWADISNFLQTHFEYSKASTSLLHMDNKRQTHDIQFLLNLARKEPICDLFHLSCLHSSIQVQLEKALPQTHQYRLILHGFE
uniref:Uncharacterized protein n=1 Tax=Opuntia streptacantha TaxID=393608 RepID=A0A7C9EZ71_OPUST